MKINQDGYVTQGERYRSYVATMGREEAQLYVLENEVCGETLYDKEKEKHVYGGVPTLPSSEVLNALSMRNRANLMSRKILQTMALAEVVEMQFAILAPVTRHQSYTE